jgi:hypothetical protein
MSFKSFQTFSLKIKTKLLKMNLKIDLCTKRKFTELNSQIFNVLSSDADTKSLLSLDHATSDIPNL